MDIGVRATPPSQPPRALPTTNDAISWSTEMDPGFLACSSHLTLVRVATGTRELTNQPWSCSIKKREREEREREIERETVGRERERVRGEKGEGQGRRMEEGGG